MNSKKNMKWVALLIVALCLAGCGAKQERHAAAMNELETKKAEVTALENLLAMQETRLSEQEALLADQDDQLSQKEALIAAQKDKIRQKEAEIARKERDIVSAREETFAAESKAQIGGRNTAMQQMAGKESLFPPNANLGECYARIFVPHQMQITKEQVLVKAASERIETLPAEYEMVDEKIMIEEASQKLEVVPAAYGWEEKKVMVEPARYKLVEIPAEYETVTEKILVKPAHTAWKKGKGLIQRIDEATGEIMCLVEIPAEYKTVTKKMLSKPATTQKVQIPAVYKTVKQQVMISPPTTRVVEIPAKYDTIKVSRLVTPAREKHIPIPAEYITVTKQQVISEDHMEWREVLCETNMTRSRVSQIQQALKENGFDPGPVDGILGSKTMQAANEYQREKGLLVSDYLTINTLKSLGVNPR